MSHKCQLVDMICGRAASNIRSLTTLQQFIRQASYVQHSHFNLSKYLTVMRKVLGQYEVSILDMCSAFEEVGVVELGLFVSKVYYQMLQLIRRLLRYSKAQDLVPEYFEEEEVKKEEQTPLKKHNYIAQVYAQLQRGQFLIRGIDKMINHDTANYGNLEEMEEQLAKVKDKIMNTSYSSAANLLHESLAVLRSHDKYNKNYYKVTEDNIRAEKYVMECLDTYTISSNWSVEQFQQKKQQLAQKILKIIEKLKNEGKNRPKYEKCIMFDAETQTNEEQPLPNSYTDHKKMQMVQEWELELRNTKLLLDMTKDEKNEMESQLKKLREKTAEMANTIGTLQRSILTPREPRFVAIVPETPPPTVLQKPTVEKSMQQLSEKSEFHISFNETAPIRLGFKKTKRKFVNSLEGEDGGKTQKFILIEPETPKDRQVQVKPSLNFTFRILSFIILPTRQKKSRNSFGYEQFVYAPQPATVGVTEIKASDTSIKSKTLRSSVQYNVQKRSVQRNSNQGPSKTINYRNSTMRQSNQSRFYRPSIQRSSTGLKIEKANQTISKDYIQVVKERPLGTSSDETESHPSSGLLHQEKWGLGALLRQRRGGVKINPLASKILFNTKDFELFGGIEQAQNLEKINMVENEKKVRSSINPGMMPRRRGAQIQNASVICQLNIVLGNGNPQFESQYDEHILELYAHVNRLKNTAPKFYNDLRNMLRFPHSFLSQRQSPVWNYQQNEEHPLTLFEFKRIMRRIWKTHAKCLEQNHTLICEHIQNFYVKMGYISKEAK